MTDTILLTHSMVQSPSWANWFAASQEIPRISRNPKVHYRIHKRPPPVPILGQPNPKYWPFFLHHCVLFEWCEIFKGSLQVCLLLNC